MGANANFNLLDTRFGDRVLNAAAIAAIIGVGNPWFVDEATGNDANPGSTLQYPFKTLTAALAAATANNGDTIYLMGTVHISATVLWNKNGVNLVSLLSPSNNGRGRISQTGSSVFTPLVNVTATGCAFVGFATFHGFANASAQVCWQEAGGRNYYSNVQFLGMGNATAAAQTGGRSLVVSGSGENLFEDCTIGLDTVVRATGANASLEFTGGTPRNVFRRSIFQSLVSLATDVHVKIGASGIDRYVIFEDTSFVNAVDSTATAMNAAIAADNAAGGSVLVQGDTMSVGATAIAVSGPVYVNNALGATTSGIGLHAT